VPRYAKKANSRKRLLTSAAALQDGARLRGLPERSDQGETALSLVFHRPGPAAAQPTRWRVQEINAIGSASAPELPTIVAADVRPIAIGLDFWDMWQLSREDGTRVIQNGRSWWFFLAAPRAIDPEERHDHARIHIVSRGVDGWQDHGIVLPTGWSPGSREWSGSCILGSDGKTVRLYFTAAGRPEGGPRFEQRLFLVTGTFDATCAIPISNWSRPIELFHADGQMYAIAAEAEPSEGMIRGFRDPTSFLDPVSGSEYVLFTATSGPSGGPFAGVIGAARRAGSQWSLLPPVIDATGVNNELERPHILFRDGLYYLFWSTHASRFAPGVQGRTGLYGMVSERMDGPWRPLNGTSLVACNPAEEPIQAYCWWVTTELEVISFVNYWGLGGRSIAGNPILARQTFGGTVAPPFRLELKGDQAIIV
jgi:levansucrase